MRQSTTSRLYESGNLRGGTCDTPWRIVLPSSSRGPEYIPPRVTRRKRPPVVVHVPPSLQAASSPSPPPEGPGGTPASPPESSAWGAPAVPCTPRVSLFEMVPDEQRTEQDEIADLAVGPLPLNLVPFGYPSGEVARLQRHVATASEKSRKVSEEGATELNLAHCLFGLSQVQALVDVLPRCASLTCLKLCNNALDDTHVGLLVAGVVQAGCNLQVLDLSNNRLGPKCGEVRCLEAGSKW